jgi:CheY-like chemotaxis protein
MKKAKGLQCILLVDDDNATNFYHQMIIKKTNIDCHVQVALNGQEAIDYLTSNGSFSHQTEFPQPGLILLDINMPIMNGWEFLGKYEELPLNQKGNIVMAMLTTSLNPEDKERAKTFTHLEDFLNKPLNKEKLLGVVHEFFE